MAGRESHTAPIVRTGLHSNKRPALRSRGATCLGTAFGRIATQNANQGRSAPEKGLTSDGDAWAIDSHIARNG
jgi:hypothetical protein